MILESSTPQWVIVVIFGTILFFLITFLDVNAATFASATGTLEFTKVELLVEGVFRNREYLLILGVLVIVFMLVHFLKRINYNYSVEIAIAIGTGAYIVLSLVVELVLHSLTTQRLLGFVIGGLIDPSLFGIGMPANSAFFWLLWGLLMRETAEVNGNQRFNVI